MVKSKKTVKKKSPAKVKRSRSSAARSGKSKPKMQKSDLKIFKDILLRERKKIGGEIDHIAKDALNKSQRDSSGDLSGYSFHMADVASDNYDVEFSLGRASDEQKSLFRIDEALRRISDGSYGRCQQCNKLIAKKRLVALPYSELCIECQKDNEVK